MNTINVFNDSQNDLTKKKSIPQRQILAAVKKVLNSEKTNDEPIDDAIINIVVVNDHKIQKINFKYLRHDYPTDVIAFRLNEDNEPLEGEIYISIDMAKTNAKIYKTQTNKEIVRYAIHGVLHILGYNDKSLEDNEKMRNLEDFYLEKKEETI